MLEYVVLVAIIVFYAYLVSFFMYVPVFLINISLIIVFAIRVPIDLKKLKMARYYFMSGFLTAFIFIFHDSYALSPIFRFFRSIYVLEFVVATLSIFFFAHLFRQIDILLKNWIKTDKK